MKQDKVVEADFRSFLAETVANRAYVKVHYYSDLHELLKTTSVVKGLEVQDGIEQLQLATGELIPLHQLVRVGSRLAPGHNEDDFYSCGC